MRKFTKNNLSSEINEDFKDIFIRLYDYMIDKKWIEGEIINKSIKIV